MPQTAEQSFFAKHPILKWLLILFGAAIAVYAVFFVRQVLQFRGQILSGEFDFTAYGTEITGSGGANISNKAYDVATDDDPSMGPEDAAVTIVEFSDFECPFCLRAFPIIRTLAMEFKDEVRYVYRDFPIADVHPNARLAAVAGFCAHEQGKFWPMHDKLFQNQETLSQSAILAIGRQVGLNEAQFGNCLGSDRAQQEIDADLADGITAGVLGTPTWFINGVRVAGVIPEEVFRQLIEDIVRNK